jgi:methyltransferase-like protein/2-polyprenyl-3-methyl-5-hydroxy-6-metoxy-1,4-benzoquinol methylase
MSTANSQITAYEEVLYPAGIYRQTHPDRLATIGTLRGMRPASIDSCRVLEMACGAGHNLIAIASNLPGSEFIGVDLAKNAISSGQALIAGLALENVLLHHLDVCQLNRERFGRFDYIIAHGLYSWVPHSVQKHIIAACREMLNPQGIAYVSYNAQPGNHLRDLSRGIMRYHVAHFEDPKEKIRQARGILKFIGESRVNANPYVTAVKTESERVMKYTDEVFYHDDLSDINQAFYFQEFITAAEQESLQFLGEASPNELGPRNFVPEVIAKLRELEGSGELVREQYKDFFLGRAFRETLLCHGAVRLAPDFLSEKVSELFCSCDAIQSDEQGEDESLLFRRHEGSEVRIKHPQIAAALKYLCAQWPCAVPFEQVLNIAGPEPTVGDRVYLSVAQAMTSLYKAGFVEFHVKQPRVVSSVSQRPTSSRLARFQLQHGEMTSDQLHKPVKFADPVVRQLILLLDGSRDQERIARELTDFVKSRASETDPDEFATSARSKVDKALETLVRGAMLIA